MLIDQEFNLFDDEQQLMSNVVHLEKVPILPTLKNDQIIRFEIPASVTSFTRSNFNLRLKWRIKNG